MGALRAHHRAHSMHRHGTCHDKPTVYSVFRHICDAPRGAGEISLAVSLEYS